MLRTTLTDLLGCSVPVLNAPMAGGHAGSALAAAVTAGGGVGMVGVTRGTPVETLTAELVAAGPGTGAGLLAWSLDDEPALFDTVVAARPTLASVAYGDWRPWIERLRASDIRCATTAGTLDAAREAADAGVDVLVVRGAEGGGHGRNEVGTLPLLQEVLERVEHPCVVAAGGIGTGRGLAAVLAAGAAGAWVGTALLPSDQAGTSARARSAMRVAASTDTAYSRVYDVVGGVWPAEFGGRSLRNEYIDRWGGHESEMDAETVATIAAGEPVVYAGQGVGLVGGDRPAERIVVDLAEQAERLLRRWSQPGGTRA